MVKLPYIKEFEIHYYEINKYQEATPVSILNYLEETAICHSEAIGFGVAKLLEMGLGWVLNRWKITMLRYPEWNEKIVVETWPSGFDRFYASREFRILDSNGLEIGKASSVWLLVNLERKRPVRITAEIFEAYGICDRKAHREFHDFKNRVEPKEAIDFYVRRSDIDTNNHVNNTKYLEWMLEALPDDIIKEHTLNSFEIFYKKETVYGSSIISCCSTSGSENEEFSYMHCIKDKDKDVELSYGKTNWVKRL